MISKAAVRKMILIVGTASLMFLAGCGGGPSQVPSQVTNQSPPISVSVTPSGATVIAGGVQQFTATVSPSGANQAVTWSVSGAGCTGASCGTIDATGKYTAPATAPNPPTVTVTATSLADSSKSASASVAFADSPDIVSIALAADPSHKFGKFAYVANTSSNNVTMYTINAATGMLEFIGTIAAGTGPTFVAVHPGRFAYVANRSSNSISMYTIDATTGALEPIGIIAAGTNPVSVAVDPSGKFAYVANQGSNNVSMYTIDGTTGALTSTETVAAATNPSSVTVDPSGKFAYVVNSTSNNVSMYTINPTTGTLEPVGTIAAGTRPVSVAVDPAGKFAYVTNCGDLLAVSSDVSMYTINPTTGTLSSIGTTGAGGCPWSVAVDPSGKFAYVANSGNLNDQEEGVSMYTINASTGTLTSIGIIGAGVSPTSVAIDPSGKFAYVANAISKNVSMYAVDATTGALTLIGTIGT